MTTEIKVPALPESVADATVLEWHKKPGDTVKRDENLVDLETDKIVLEVPAPADGVLASISAEVGAIVESDALLALFEEGAAGAPAPTVEAAAPADASGNAAQGSSTRKALADNNLNASDVTATGKGGRLLKEDVTQAAATSKTVERTQEAAPVAAEVTRNETAFAPKQAAQGEREISREPMSRMRTTIAKRLVNAQQSTAMLTTFNEVDMAPVMALRSKHKDLFLEQHDTKLGFMSFFVKAAVAGLQKFPMVNSQIDGTDVVKMNFNDVGIAVSSPRGLVVPILRNVENYGFADIESSIRDFGMRAQKGTLAMDELTGGTFTITNGGVFGSMLSTPILNPPQSAILGMHSITKRAVVVNDEIVIRPMMYLALSYDHRIVDGKEAVQFLVAVKNAIEDPTRLLLDLK